MNIHIPMPVKSEANERGHWRSKAARVKAQRTATCYELRSRRVPVTAFPVTIRFVRLGPQMLDDDNLQSAFKAVRDGVADYFGVDDGDPGYTWQYAQERAKVPGIRIEINPTTGQ